MGIRRRRPIEPLRSGDFRLNLSTYERTAVARLLGQLRDTLTVQSPDHATLRRIFPTAYHLDVDADAEYQRLMREELVASRLGAIETVEGALQSERLTESETVALMQSINALRLVLGTALDVGEEHDIESVAADHPLAAGLHVYNYLSWLLDSIVQALSSRL